MNPLLRGEMGRLRAEELRHRAAIGNRARAPKASIRWAGPADEPAIATLAALDSRSRPPGEMLVAEVGGEILAAVTADGTQAIADPFRPTKELVSRLIARAAALSRDGSGRGRPIGRRRAALGMPRRLV
jgi:hypothetical protein